MDQKKSFIKRLLGAKTAEAPAINTYNIRGQNVNDEDINLLKAVVFGELSNKKENQTDEVKTIINTAINRIPQHNARGKNFSLSDTLTQKNAYQAYGGKEYNKYLQNKLNYLDRKKADFVNNAVTDIIRNNLVDNTGGKVNYIHDKKGNLILIEGNLYK